jgi:hypothetical protein
MLVALGDVQHLTSLELADTREERFLSGDVSGKKELLPGHRIQLSISDILADPLGVITEKYLSPCLTVKEGHASHTIHSGKDNLPHSNDKRKKSIKLVEKSFQLI